MTNKEIAANFRKLADLLELLEENPFKIRSYRNAYTTLRRLPLEVSDMKKNEIEKIKGVGKAISSKIEELIDSGNMSAIDKARANIPPGVEELLSIKGLGPGKVRNLWKGLEVNSPGELLYACEENRLLGLKGFGEKSQRDIRSKVEYYLSQRGLFFYSELKKAGDKILEILREKFPSDLIEYSGSMRRLMPTLDRIDILTTLDMNKVEEIKVGELKLVKGSKNTHEFLLNESIPVLLHYTQIKDFGVRQFFLTGPSEFVEKYNLQKGISLKTEGEIFNFLGEKYIMPEHRDWTDLDKASNIVSGDLIKKEEIKGVVHAHSHYSDGLNSLADMALATQKKGYQYLAITDHSAYASYAGGMSVEEVQKQWDEIDRLNSEMNNFRIIKGIEADILPDGSLDYDPDFLMGFELVIASVHSVLNMDLERAVSRLIKAIENPATNMLGHPTGRLLLSRQGYPLDMPKILDACAANGVHIEINANPHRLDLDWKWIYPAMERGIRFSINPDAHHKIGIDDIQYGVAVARKGGMTREVCINTYSADLFLESLKK